MDAIIIIYFILVVIKTNVKSYQLLYYFGVLYVKFDFFINNNKYNLWSSPMTMQIKKKKLNYFFIFIFFKKYQIGPHNFFKMI